MNAVSGIDGCRGQSALVDGCREFGIPSTTQLVRRPLPSLASNNASIARDSKQHYDLEIKSNKLCDTVIVLTEIIKTQSKQSTNIKNVVVASAFIQETRKLS